jgi:diguanylate cyclase (GGDEF)-like protein
MGDPAILAGSDGRIVFMNVSALSMLEVNVNDYLGQNLMVFLKSRRVQGLGWCEESVSTKGAKPIRLSVPSMTNQGTRHFLVSADWTDVGLLVTFKDNTEVENLTTIDALTGAHNRREFDRLMLLELNRADRGYVQVGCATGPGVSLIFIDVDFFKEVNTRHGHPGGDHVLREVVKVIGSCVRKEDHVCRYGGEEFCVIMSTSDENGVRRKAEQVREAIERHEMNYGSQKIRVTVSIGTATLTGLGKSGMKSLQKLRTPNPFGGYGFVASEDGNGLKEVPLRRGTPPRFDCLSQQMIDVASKACLSAKSEGRNRVIAAPQIKVL